MKKRAMIADLINEQSAKVIVNYLPIIVFVQLNCYMYIYIYIESHMKHFSNILYCSNMF